MTQPSRLYLLSSSEKASAAAHCASARQPRLDLRKSRVMNLGTLHPCAVSCTRPIASVTAAPS
ncbi:hypothetical protein E2562_023049, partial [Oryza meyeriana var. granulata]